MQRPQLGPEAYKTYAIVRPLGSHWRKATCEEVNCPAWQNGWLTRLAANDTGNIAFITSGRTGRVWREIERSESGERQFVFPAGQPCLRCGEHRVPLEREPLFVVRDGDRRGNPFGTRPVQRRVDDWVDDFATHQQGIADAIEKG